MPTFELSLSPSYVIDWTLEDAIREIFQNFIDQQIINSENKMSWSYEDETLEISGLTSVLERSSLLLGGSTKADDEETIGKFGEGYKLALLVLTRLGHAVQIRNYAKKELWAPEISASKDYKVEVLKVKVIRHFFKSVPDHNLTFRIRGISAEHLESIKLTNLHIEEPDYDETVVSDNGRVLLNPKYHGRIYVKGLFVATIEPREGQKGVKYGYDFNPKHIKLDRDRKLIQDYDVNWQTSQMWMKAPHTGENSRMIADLAREGYKDVGNIQYHYRNNKDAHDIAHREFIEEHGDKAVPVTSQADMTKAKESDKRCKPVIVSEPLAYLVKGSSSYQVKSPKQIRDKYAKVRDKKPQELLQKFYSNMRNVQMPKSDRKALERIFEMSKEWGWK